MREVCIIISNYIYLKIQKNIVQKVDLGGDMDDTLNWEIFQL